MQQNNIKYLQAALQTLAEQNYLITNEKWQNSVESLKYRLLLAETLDMTSQCDLSDDLSVMDYIKEVVTDIPDVSDSVEASDVIEKKAFNFFTEVAQSAFGENNITLRMQYKSLMALAEFCDSHLKRTEEEAQQQQQPSEKSLQYADTLAKSVLSAMRVHAGEFSSSVLKFPRLLQTNELYGERIVCTFMKEAEHVPSWMFLSWVGHLVALLDSDIATSIHPIMQVKS